MMRRSVFVKIEWYPGELHPRIGSVVANPSRPTKRVVPFEDRRGTAEEHTREAFFSIKWIRLLRG